MFRFVTASRSFMNLATVAALIATVLNLPSLSWARDQSDEVQQVDQPSEEQIREAVEGLQRPKEGRWRISYDVKVERGVSGSELLADDRGSMRETRRINERLNVDTCVNFRKAMRPIGRLIEPLARAETVERLGFSSTRLFFASTVSDDLGKNGTTHFREGHLWISELYFRFENFHLIAETSDYDPAKAGTPELVFITTGEGTYLGPCL